MSETDLAQIRHKLRTPINHIIGYSEMLQEEAEDLGCQGLLPGFQRVRDLGQQLFNLVTERLEAVETDTSMDGLALLHKELRKPIGQTLRAIARLEASAESHGRNAIVHDLQRIRAAAESLASIARRSLPDDGPESGSTHNSSRASGGASRPSLVQRGIPSWTGPGRRDSANIKGYLLVVEDNATTRHMLCRRLEHQGHQVAEAENGRKALEMVRAHTFDLVLLDLMMPDVNGLQVLEQLKSDDSLRHIPVIMLSALEEVDSTVRCIEMGAEDFLTKPFNPVLLKARIDACLEKKLLRDQEVLYLQEIESINTQLEKRVGERVKELRKLEERLLHSQKMESIGRLAGGIAHDFNNLLTPIMGYATLGSMYLTPEHPTHGYLDEVKRAAERASSLTHQLLAFSKGQLIEPKVTNLNNLVLNMGDLLRRLIGEHIELVTLPGPDLELVKVDPGQIEQVLLNLVINARDAMPQGGKLTVETANVSLDAEFVRQHPDAAAGNYVLLLVLDTGVGMNETVKAHLFEPFFTTKERGKGTGLGLATCYGIVQQSGGRIEVESEEGKGTCFRIYLPTTDEASGTESKTREDEGLPGGTETVLLAEDEPAVRGMIATILQHQGYTVLQAANGDEALKIAKEHGHKEIDLLLTDVVMPQMGGVELADRFSAEYPNTKVIFTSGYSDQPIVTRKRNDLGIEFIQKPFMPAALASKVREVLDRD